MVKIIFERKFVKSLLLIANRTEKLISLTSAEKKHGVVPVFVLSVTNSMMAYLY